MSAVFLFILKTCLHLQQYLLYYRSLSAHSSHSVCLEFISCLYSVCCISLHSKDVFTLATISVVLQVAVSSLSDSVCLEFISCLYSVCCISLHSKDMFTLATSRVQLKPLFSVLAESRIMLAYFDRCGNWKYDISDARVKSLKYWYIVVK